MWCIFRGMVDWSPPPWITLKNLLVSAVLRCWHRLSLWPYLAVSSGVLFPYQRFNRPYGNQWSWRIWSDPWRLLPGQYRSYRSAGISPNWPAIWCSSSERGSSAWLHIQIQGVAEPLVAWGGLVASSSPCAALFLRGFMCKLVCCRIGICLKTCYSLRYYWHDSTENWPFHRFRTMNGVVLLSSCEGRETDILLPGGVDLPDLLPP